MHDIVFDDLEVHFVDSKYNTTIHVVGVQYTGCCQACRQDFPEGVTFPISSIPLHMHASTYARTHAHTHTHTHTLTHTHILYIDPLCKIPSKLYNYPQSKRVTEYIVQNVTVMVNDIITKWRPIVIRYRSG